MRVVRATIPYVVLAVYAAGSYARADSYGMPERVVRSRWSNTRRMVLWSGIRPKRKPRLAPKVWIAGCDSSTDLPQAVLLDNQRVGDERQHASLAGVGGWRDISQAYGIIRSLTGGLPGGIVSYSLALGPFHPAWRGPQRFVLRLHGERISDIEYHDGFNERGCADRLARLDLPQALHLVTRICGTCSFAHSLAFCQAIEHLCGLPVSPRAALLRCVVAELERGVSHVRAAAGVLDALGMEGCLPTLDEAREDLTQALWKISGARVIPDLCVPGGMRRTISAPDREKLLVALPKLNRRLYGFIDGLIDQRALLSRTVDVGTLPREAAEQFGVRGPLARASGIGRDARADHPYAGYAQLAFRAITQEGGDVYARLMVLLLEAYESVKLVEQALQDLPDGAWQGELPQELRSGQGSGVVEGPHGLIRYGLECNGQRLTVVRIDAPRQLDRLIARTLLSGALVDNAVAIIVSTDPCTACAER